MCVFQVFTDGTDSRGKTGHYDNSQKCAYLTFTSDNGSSCLADETIEGCRHTHANLKYTCKLCVSEFDDINQWLHHVRTIHDRRQYVCRGQYVCPECQHVYVSKGGLWKHVYKMHKKLTTYRCETCGKNFFVSSVYHDHVAAHTGVKRYTCSICEMRFTNKCTLKRHVVRVHPDVATHIL